MGKYPQYEYMGPRKKTLNGNSWVLEGVHFSFIGKIKKKEVSSVIMEIPVFSDLKNCRHVGGWSHARWGLGIILQVCLFGNHYHSHWLGFNR